MEYQKVSSAPFSKKLTNSHSFSGTSIYDGVFSGPMKVASYVDEDFGEIFGGSSSSSIPVLDVPELNERKVTVDVKSSKLDYSKIFGGFGEFDFAVSHEELFAKSSKSDSFVEEARTTAEAGSHPSNSPVENQVLSHDASYQSLDGAKEFKMSYHKANQERRIGTNGTTHVTQLHAVPGYTCLIDEFAPSGMTECDKPLSSALNGTRLNGNFSGELREGKHGRKASSVLSHTGSSKRGSGDGVKFQNEYNHSRSSSYDMLFDGYETGPRTQPSKVTLPSSRSDGLGNNGGDCKTSKGLKIGVSKSSSSEDATGFCSPPYFEEEVDTNSVAAASAAAVKKAIEEAQARIKLAKEIMEREKVGLQNHVKLRFNDGPRTKERREDKYTDKTNLFREEVLKKCGKGDAPLHVYAGLGTQNAIKAGQMAPDLREREGLLFAEEAPVGTQGDKNDSTLMDHRLEEMKDLNSEKREGIGMEFVQSVNDFELKDEILTVKRFEHPDENGKKLKATEDSHKQEEKVERKLKAVQGACELKECAFEEKSGQGVRDQEECVKKSRVTGLKEEKEATFIASHDEEAHACELKDCAFEEKSGQGVRDQEECVKKSRVTGLKEEKEATFIASHDEKAHEKTQRRQWEQNANENMLKMQLGELEECGKKSRDQEVERKLKAVHGVCDLKECALEVNSGQGVRDQEECVKNSRVTGLQGEKEVTFIASHDEEAHENKQRRQWEQNANENKLKMELDELEECGKKSRDQEVERKLKTVQGACELKECALEEKSGQGVRDQEECVKKSIASHDEEAHENKQRRQWEQNADENELKIQLDELEECGKKSSDQEVERMLKTVQGACELKECAFEEKSGQEVRDQEECVKNSRVTGLQEEKEVTFIASHDKEAHEKKQRRRWEQIAYENKLKMQLDELEECGKKSRVQEVERKLKTVQGAFELKECAFEEKSGHGVCDQEGVKKSRVSGFQEKKEMTFIASHEEEAREKKQRRQWERNGNENKLKTKLDELEECGKKSSDQDECGMESMVAVLLEEKEMTFKAYFSVENCEKKQRRLWAQNAIESKLVLERLKDDECTKMRLLKDELVGLENEKKQKELLEQKETDIRSEDVPEKDENEAALTDTFDHEAKGKRSGATCERVEFEKQQTEACSLELNKDEQEDLNGRQDAGKTSDEALEQEIEVRISEFHDVEQSGKKFEEDVGLRTKEMLIEAEENEQILKRAYRMEGIEKRAKESCEWGETENFQTEIDQRQDDINMKVTQEACEHFRNNLEAANDVCQQDKIEIPSETLEASVHAEYLEVPSHEENGRVMEATQASSGCKGIETEVDVVDLANDQEEEGIFEDETADIAQVVLEHDGIEKQVEDTTEAPASEHNVLNTGEPDTDVWQKLSDQHGKEFNTICNTGNDGEELASEFKEKFEDAEEVEGAMNLEEDESNSESSNEDSRVDNGENMEATQLHSMVQGKGESPEIAAQIKTSQNKEQYKGDHSKSLKTKGMEAEVTTQKEVEVQREQVVKIDLAKEKEKEREERIAVERAIREAHERAFTEAREKAERAAIEKTNTETRRRAMAETRERSEKTSREVNHKSEADKTSVEARLKAERDAVERATAEARMRALEKAMSQKAASKARNHAVKSSGPSRENGTSHSSASNDSLSKGSGATKSSGYSNSSSYDVPRSMDKFDGVNGEPVQRHKARLESHRRIAERAAKALAEKNMRDLLAQKEQAERNRLAEALDADVKRWSQGKAGNLRALLSTLQYILGPDGGWQPIPLTDLIATGAVKKAYRKATLYVHPDKLQQRGASTQQKYICEKVFDLLKEAWNRFNAEER